MSACGLCAHLHADVSQGFYFFSLGWSIELTSGVCEVGPEGPHTFPKVSPSPPLPRVAFLNFLFQETTPFIYFQSLETGYRL